MRRFLETIRRALPAEQGRYAAFDRCAPSAGFPFARHLFRARRIGDNRGVARAAPLALLVLVFALAAPALAPRPPAGALFVEISAAAGLAGIEARNVSFADLDGDGAPDAIIGRRRVFLNSKEGPFRRLVEVASLPESACVQVGDVDGDGRPDLFLARKEGGAILLGDGAGGFRVKEHSGLEARSENPISACFVDFDGDGALDLFVGNSYVAYGRSLEAYPDRLWRGRGDGTFEDVTERAGLLGVAEVGRPDSRRPTYGVAHTDWNNDGRQDLLVMTYGRQANRLWRNNGDGTFTDVAVETTFDGDADRSGTYTAQVKRDFDREDEPPFRAHGNTFDCAVADFDGDGDMDCFLAEIAHWWAGPSSDRSMLLENLGAAAGFRFRRRPHALPPRPHAGEHWNQGDMHAGWLDVDNDGRLDLLLASSDYPDEQILRLYHQREDGSFEEWTDRLGFRWVNASQISLADFDRDGATDILIGTDNTRLSAEARARHRTAIGLFRNVAARAAGNGFFTLRLRGGGRGRANRDAIGARVTISIAGRRQTREVYGGLGHAGHRDDTDCRFGVGKARIVDRVEVRWPDALGSVQVFERVPANRFYVLEQGGTLRPTSDERGIEN
jgi:hypothetical protein